MANLTIKNLKKFGHRYTTRSKLLSDVRGRYGQNGLSQATCHALLIQSAITFSSESQLKNFLKKELPKLTKQDLNEIFKWKQPSFSSHASEILAILRDEKANLTMTEKQFLLSYAYQIYKVSTPNCENISMVEFIKDMMKYSMRYYKKEDFFEILESLDYVEYFNPEANKKELLEFALNI